MSEDSLVLIPLQKWNDLEDIFKNYWPRSITAVVTLETQRNLIQRGLDYGFKVFCPFGELKNGMVAVNKKGAHSEFVILNFNNSITKLEQALRETELINWTQPFEVPYAPISVANCVKTIANDKKAKADYAVLNDVFVLDKSNALFEDVRLTSDFSFELLSLEHVQLVNEKWPHRHANSSWYFELLIKAKQGYGLFKHKTLISWVFIKEMGALGHLYTLEEHRRKGYGEAVLKLISNTLLKENKYVIAFCIQNNIKAQSLYKKLGFKIFDQVEWLHFNG